MGDVQLGALERRQQDDRRWRRATAWQRAGWTVFALLLLAALAGLAGPGPLSRATASAPLVHVAYERFARRLGDTSLDVTVRADPARPGVARLWIDGGYLAAVRVQDVVPEPDSWTSAGGGTVLAFPVAGDRAEVSIRLGPDHIGTLDGAIGVPGRPPARFWQFIYP